MHGLLWRRSIYSLVITQLGDYSNEYITTLEGVTQTIPQFLSDHFQYETYMTGATQHGVDRQPYSWWHPTAAACCMHRAVSALLVLPGIAAGCCPPCSSAYATVLLAGIIVVILLAYVIAFGGLAMISLKLLNYQRR